MTPKLDAIKKKFREGQHAQAIAECEELCAQNPADHEAKRLCATMNVMVRDFRRALVLLTDVRNPHKEDPDVLFNIAMCERELQNFDAASEYFQIFTDRFPKSPDGWAGLAECRFQLNELDEGIKAADHAIRLDAKSIPAWTVRGHCQRVLGRFDDAIASYRKAIQLQPGVEACFNAGLACLQAKRFQEGVDFLTQAIRLAPNDAGLKLSRGDALQAMGKLAEAIADYKAALAIMPGDGDTLKKATMCMLDLGQGEQALDLCQQMLKLQPDNLTARLGAEWVRSQLVPLWHVPMMNEPERNQAYFDGLKSVVTPDKLVFEIGTGSGLLAMMSARLGAKKVVTCEAVSLVARTAAKIVERNGFKEQVTVLAKPSQQVQLGADLPEQADVLVHEIFSSELLGEHVLPAIEDAKQRLLKPGGVIMPRSASIMIALVGGDEIAQNSHVTEAFGFDVSEFNAIYPKKRPLYREDLQTLHLSEDVEAFRFDFMAQSAFAPEARRLEIRATQGGRCYGVIQWIRIEMAEGVYFENHPLRKRSVASWQHTLYGFDEPLQLEEGKSVTVKATHDRSRPWFELG